jgi:hypothetical protein
VQEAHQTDGNAARKQTGETLRGREGGREGMEVRRFSSSTE